MTDQSTPEGKTDLLTPKEVRRVLAGEEGWQTLGGFVYAPRTVERLCRDYLTLWDRNLDLTIKVDGLRKALEKFNTVLVDAYLGRLQ